MQDNLYATPKSQLDIPNEWPVIQEFYVVSKLKFFVLFFSTLGLYTIYWNYKNWKQYKVANNKNISPVARTIFMIFYMHALFSAINVRAREQDVTYSWHPNLWATLVVLSIISENLLSRVESVDVFINAVIFFSFFIRSYFLFRAQAAINIACNDPDGMSNRHFSWVNFIWIIPGSLLFLLSIAGVFMVE